MDGDSAAKPIELTSPVAALPGVRRADADAMAELGLRAVAHLIAHVPARYETEMDESEASSLVPETIGATRGEVTACRVAGFGSRQRFEAVLMDGSARVNLVWFNAPYLTKKIGAGTRLWVQGKVREHNGTLQIANPRFEVLREGDAAASGTPTGARLRPVYPASERAKSRTIERAVDAALPLALQLIEEHLPDPIRALRDLPRLAEAYRMVHRPIDEAEAARGRRRLAYDELLMLQLGVFLKRAYVRRELRAPALRHDEATRAAILRRLPFTLTAAQQRVVGEVGNDLSQTVPANRLIQGDVGSGKTAVAAYALMMAVASGHQGALMAPTEILAEQHDAGMQRLLAGSKVRIELLTGALTAAERESALGRVRRGEAEIVIGTHALLTDAVRFKSLAVVVIDEQHRFGVQQRAHLRSRDPAEDPDAEHTTPHTLVMTATPIPRTLAMTLFGDLDVSTIDELPPGRSPIRTEWVPPAARGRVDATLKAAIERGERAFWVVPAIDGGGEGEMASVTATQKRLEQGPLAGRRTAVLHGRMQTRVREHVMERFRRGLIDCLVATTVIEVGVDVPEATVMVIENADRFGLAQLHQLRGRVGRGAAPSICLLIGDPQTEDGRQRLEAMAASTDGFVLAERDLEIRGPGELFGARQSGAAAFKVADLSRDLALLRDARADAAAWVEASPHLDRPEDAVMRRRLGKRYGEAIGLVDVG